MGEFVKEDVAAWQTRIVRERQTPRITLNLSLAEKKERNELLILLRKVKEFWVEGVLEHSVHGEALIDLGKEKWGEEEEHPWEQVLELPDQTTRTLPPGQPLGDLFDEVGRSLLILGAPGSGKTITLLDLACTLIKRAEADPAQPIPVVFNLSSWTDPHQVLFDWLAEELSTKYLVPKKLGRSWLEENWLLPLLDGLRFGLFCGLFCGLVFGMSGAFFWGFREGVIEERTVPNLGIKLTIRNAIFGGGGMLLFGLMGGLFVGLMGGLFAVFWYGGMDVIQHYILRLILYRKGRIPRRYARFLNYAAKLVFLQKVGGGYLFIHRYLLEHFAALGEASEAPEMPAPLAEA